jgi:hypothetical protein
VHTHSLGQVDCRSLSTFTVIQGSMFSPSVWVHASVLNLHPIST